MRSRLTSFIDFFYPPFKKILPIQTFRYAVSGGFNTIVGLVTYAFFLESVFDRQVVGILNFHFKPHNAALFVSFIVSLTLGFLLNKYIVFTSASGRGHIQLAKYFLSFFTNLIINYGLLKLFVEVMGLDAIIAQVITTSIIIVFGYLTQKHFTFKTSKAA